MEKPVFVVTFYHDEELTTTVCGVYATRALADAAIAEMDPSDGFGDLYEIHEMPLIEAQP